MMYVFAGKKIIPTGGTDIWQWILYSIKWSCQNYLYCPDVGQVKEEVKQDIKDKALFTGVKFKYIWINNHGILF